MCRTSMLFRVTRGCVFGQTESAQSGPRVDSVAQDVEVRTFRYLKEVHPRKSARRPAIPVLGCGLKHGTMLQWQMTEARD